MRQILQFEVLKEPRGFIKVIQVLIAIFAFATCTGYRGEISFSQTCPTGVNHLASAKFKYPFQQSLIFNLMDCNTNNTGFQQLIVGLGYKSSVEYYVVCGVFCFLYSLGMLTYYIAFEPDVPSGPPPKISLPVLDFVISGVFVLFWFTSVIACAASITGLKGDTDVTKIINSAYYCRGKGGPGILCSIAQDGNYATMDISALLGFLNVFVWAGNMWFLFKETPWHSPRGKAAATVSGPGRDQPSQVTPPAAAI